MNGDLVVDIEKRYARGATVRAAFSQLADGFHSTVLFGPSGSGKTTILRCLGVDHTRLTFRYQGRDYRLTDVHGNVVDEILA